MPIWRCPHCGVPQAETARCWVCHKSSTTCLTCRHYRRSVDPRIGYCGMVGPREKLAGDEMRPCWEGSPVPPPPLPPTADRLPRHSVALPIWLDLETT
jgi:hypothetical protein